jgi:hypothetical protein
MVAGGIATTTLFHRSRLQILSYGILGGKNIIFLALFTKYVRVINRECHNMGEKTSVFVQNFSQKNKVEKTPAETWD